MEEDTLRRAYAAGVQGGVILRQGDRESAGGEART